MNYQDLDVWKEAMDLAKKIYLVTKDFPKDEIYGLTSQIRRSSVSIPSNIAEGSTRQTDKEMIQFLYIALGSLAELQTQVILSKEIGYLGENMRKEIESVRKKLLGLIKYLKGKQGNSVKNSGENYIYE